MLINPPNIREELEKLTGYLSNILNLRILAEFEKLASLFFAFNPHVLVCMLRLKASKRLALFQIELRISTLHFTGVYLLLMSFRKYIFLLFIVFLVQGCSSIKESSDTTLLSTTSSQLKQKYKISHADLVVQYDLTNKNNKCIYAKNLGLIINNPKQNKIFLQKFHNKNPAEFNKAAEIKIADIKAVVTKLNSKYKFLSKPEASYFAKKQTHRNNISELTKLDKIISTIPLMMPEYEPKITSHYGIRKSPHKKKRKKKCFHSGIDLQAKKAAPIYAAASGIVIKAARAPDYGNFVEIKHGRKLVTKYAHLKEMSVKEGNKIKRGQFIGIQGRTGNATGEHLHFEILLDNKAINPFDFIFNCRKC